MINIGRADITYPGRVQADTVAVLKMVANTEQHFTIPAGASVAVFAATDSFYALTNGQTAAVPAATSTAFPSPNTVPELNPSVLSVVAGAIMSIIAPGTPIITISFYRDTDLS